MKVQYQEEMSIKFLEALSLLCSLSSLIFLGIGTTSFLKPSNLSQTALLYNFHPLCKAVKIGGDTLRESRHDFLWDIYTHTYNQSLFFQQTFFFRIKCKHVHIQDRYLKSDEAAYNINIHLTKTVSVAVVIWSLPHTWKKYIPKFHSTWKHKSNFKINEGNNLTEVF